MFEALRQCKFAGKNYYAGEEIPASAIDKKAVAELIRMKIIAEKPAPKIEKPKVKVRRGK